MPISDNSIEMITSYGGFKSMQHKMMSGFKDSYRVLKRGGSAVYSIEVVDDLESENAKKWINLYLHCEDTPLFSLDNICDINKLKDLCSKAGFSKTTSTKIYGDLPAPNDNIFPFENEMLQWMGEHEVISTK